MHLIVRSVSSAWFLLSITVGVAAAEVRRPPGTIVGGAAPDDPTPRSAYMIVDVDPDVSVPTLPSAQPHAAPTVIYMNRTGGTYYPGNDDARSNRSSIPNSTSQVPAWNVSEAGWQQVMTCIRSQFARFNVTITDVDPGNTPHIESVVAGAPQDVGMSNGVGGVSPFAGDCSTIDNSIVFTFAEVYGNSYRAICETAAQEISHSFGLDHEYECKDPMTYLEGCGNKEFQNIAARCGEYSARTCSCGGSTQNSVAMLTQRLGLAGQNQPPTVAITQPAAGAVVPPGFAVSVTATDTGVVQRVELWIDGALTATDTASPWGFTAPATLVDGAHTLEVRAVDDAMTTASASVTVTLRTPTTGGDEDAGTGTGGGGGGDEPDAGTDNGGGGGDNGGGGSGGGEEDDPLAPDSKSDLTGGCSTGGPASGGLSALGAVGLAMWRRRRRRA